MSMLTRYKKQGGFEQLLVLIESCNKKKQEQLLTLVKAEDSSWHDRLRAKMLTMERVLAFPSNGINEIFSRIPEKVLVFALHGIAPEKHDMILATFTHFKKKAISELLAGSKPKPEEIEAANLAIFKSIRALDKERVIALHKLSPELSLDERKAA
jgi:flagellar motor switch protein FliG